VLAQGYVNVELNYDEANPFFASEYLEDSNNGADLDPGIKVVTLDRGRRRARTVKVKV